MVAPSVFSKEELEVIDNGVKNGKHPKVIWEELLKTNPNVTESSVVYQVRKRTGGRKIKVKTTLDFLKKKVKTLEKKYEDIDTSLDALKNFVFKDVHKMQTQIDEAFKLYPKQLRFNSIGKLMAWKSMQNRELDVIAKIYQNINNIVTNINADQVAIKNDLLLLGQVSDKIKEELKADALKPAAAILA